MRSGLGFGYSVSTAGDVNGDGYSDILVGTSLNKVYAFYGSASGLNTSYDWMVTGDGNGAFGYSLSTAGDVNGDGYSDVIIGAPYYNSYAGRIYIYLGSDSGLASTPAYTKDGEVYSQLGFSVNLAGDVNGDGYSDVIAGGNNYDNYHGMAIVVFGSSTGPGALLTGWQPVHRSARDLEILYPRPGMSTVMAMPISWWVRICGMVVKRMRGPPGSFLAQRPVSQIPRIGRLNLIRNMPILDGRSIPPGM